MPKPPPGVSERDFQTALRELETIVTKEWLFTSDEDVLLYRDGYSPLWGESEERYASAAVAPTTVEQVQAIVKTANKYGIPLYPVSTGRNLTYGGSAPTYSGSVVVDLKRMNRILSVSERDKTCLVEPGVSYFDMYRYLRTNNIKLWIDTADPGWGGLMGNALDRGGGYTGVDYRDHFDAHCGMEVVLPTGELVRTGMGANPNAKTWQLFKYGMGPWIDGMFSQSSFGIVTKMGFWLMEEPEAALQVSVTVPKRRDIVPLVDTLHSLMCAGTIPSQTTVSSPIMNGSADPELVRLRTSGGASDADWDRYASAQNRPFWNGAWVFYGPPKVIAAQWEHVKDKLAGIADIQFRDTASYTFPLSDEQVEAVPDKARLGIPSLNLFGSRNAPGAQPSEGHIDFSPMVAPHGEDLIALTDVTGKLYGDAGMTPSFVGGMMFHPRTMICFHAVPTFRNADGNQRTRKLFENLVRACGDRGWPIYRIHAAFQPLGMQQFGFNGGSLHRLHETLKDAVDPNGILSIGRYDIWPKRLRGSRA
ncbi:MAG TPA: FAD-dependent oxidoreductase [Gammaproteobacteria bacterium]|nr:FAD-dependent oxidoreductase [Gammaproteobacteria bacterium]